MKYLIMCIILFIGLVSCKETPKKMDFICYEGLPHQMWEQELLAKELKEKETITFNDFPFYKKPLSLESVDKNGIITYLKNKSNYGTFTPKKCGGFHPDYAIVWNDGDQQYTSLICFGCNDIFLYENKVLTKYSMTNMNILEGFLKKYRVQRPQGE